MATLKAESSFHACGKVTAFHAESSNDGPCASIGSPTKSFQPGLKLYVARREVGSAERASETKTKKPRRNTKNPASDEGAGRSQRRNGRICPLLFRFPNRRDLFLNGDAFYRPNPLQRWFKALSRFRRRPRFDGSFQ